MTSASETVGIVEQVAAMLKRHRENRYADEALASDDLIDTVFAEEIIAALPKPPPCSPCPICGAVAGINYAAPDATAHSEQQAATIAERDARIERAYRHAVRLATALHEKHFGNPEWKPLPDLFGVIDQIDNMTTAFAKVTP